MHDASPADDQESRVVQCGEGNGMAGKAGRASDRELCPRAFLKIPVTPSYWHVFRNKKHFYNVELTEEKKKRQYFLFLRTFFSLQKALWSVRRSWTNCGS